jgi:hypothetical protein
MSALSELLLGEAREEPARDLLADHRRRFAPNGRLPEMDTVVEGSHRVRLRRVVAALTANGYQVSGLEPSQKRENAQIYLWGELDYAGKLKDSLKVTLAEGDQAGYALAAQSELQQAGFLALVDVMLYVRILDEQPLSDVEVQWQELHILGSRPAVTIREAAEWVAYDPKLRCYDLMHGWVPSGLGKEEASRWMAVDSRFSEVALAQEWLAAGFTVEDAAAWREAHSTLGNYTTAAEWISEGYTPDEAHRWMGALTGPRSALKGALPWKKAGLDADACARLLEGLDASSLQRLTAMLQNGMPSEVAVAWAAMGRRMISEERAMAWHEAGYSPAQAKAWISKAGAAFEVYRLAQAYITAGFSAEQAGAWLAVHEKFKVYRRAQSWLAAGLEPEDARPWAEQDGNSCSPPLDMTDYRVVKKWIDAAITDPEIARRLRDAGVSPDQTALVRRLTT